MQQGQLREAHQHCLTILKLDENSADAWFLCGVIAAHNGQLAKATQILANAVQLAPTNAEYRAELGKQLLATNEPEQALCEAEQALALQPTGLPTLNTLGTVFSHAGEHHKALRCFEFAVKSLQAQPAQHQGLSSEWRAELYFNTAASMQFAGRFTDAEAAYEKAIELRPLQFNAHSALATLRRQTPTNNHLGRLAKLREKVKTPRDQLLLGHAIAKEQEDLGDYQSAFQNLLWAKQAQMAKVAYSAESDAEVFAGIRQIFTRQLLNNPGTGCTSAEPIFIVGMPRTGTTLLEQVLSSHSNVYAAGELQSFPLQVQRACGSTAAGIFDITTLSESLQLERSKLGNAYIDSTRPRTGHTPHFIDKLPLNFLLLGLIRLALPSAKLVCLRRDPMDTCLSNYRQLFATNAWQYYYNLDLLDCGRYYIQFDQLMSHWQEAMPGVIHEVEYEDLVENPERVTRELLTHCALPWEEQCLSFHQRSTSVATPSAVQVRQGIYTSSVGRWQRYGEAMQPLYELLSRAGLYPS